MLPGGVLYFIDRVDRRLSLFMHYLLYFILSRVFLCHAVPPFQMFLRSPCTRLPPMRSSTSKYNIHKLVHISHLL